MPPPLANGLINLALEDSGLRLPDYQIARLSILKVENRIRLLASTSILEAAESFVEPLVEKYGEKNLINDQIKSAALAEHAAPLIDFAMRGRTELHEVYARSSGRRRQSL